MHNWIDLNRPKLRKCDLKRKEFNESPIGILGKFHVLVEVVNRINRSSELLLLNVLDKWIERFVIHEIVQH